jgi:GPH family glycoside/pentoside/hexuronide:cation symporter
MLAVTGYVAAATSQSAETVSGIKDVITLYPAIALAVAALIVFFIYNLTDLKYVHLSKDLEAGRWEHGIIGESTVDSLKKA